MRPSLIRFTFEHDVSLREVEMSLHLAMFAVEGLVGRVRVRLDAKYRLDESRHSIVIGTRRPVGRMISRVFAALLLRELGEDAFRVERINRFRQHHPQEVQT